MVTEEKVYFRIDSDKTVNLTYHLNRESGPEPPGQHMIFITVQDNYGQTTTQNLAFGVVKFSTITDADFYYQLRHRFYCVPIGYRYLVDPQIRQ